MIDTPIPRAVASVLEQILDLAILAGASRDAGPPAPVTLSQVPTWIRELASGVTKAPRGCDHHTALPYSLFSFLTASDDLGVTAAREVGQEPGAAAEERRASPFWLLAALIHDLWEHSCDPSVQARDTAVLAVLEDICPPKVYDLGSGACFFAMAAASKGAMVRCAETNPTKRKFTRHLRESRGLNITTSGPRIRFDLVLAIDVLDHMVNPVEGIAGAFRRLREGGLLLLHAEFPLDGWHTGGECVVEEVFATLHRFFLPLPSDVLAAHRVLLFRRRAAPVADATQSVAGTLVRRSAAVEIRQCQPRGEYLALSNSFVVRPTLLTGLGKDLLSECVDGITVGELKRRLLERYGIEDELVDDALAALRQSRVLTLDGATYEGDGHFSH